MFYDNYVRLCNSVKKTPSAVAREIGIAKPTVSRWKNGSKPNSSTLLKVADYFGVEPSDLMDNILWMTASDDGLEHAKKAIEDFEIQSAMEKVFKEEEKPAGQTADGLDELEDDLIKAFRRLPDQMKESLLRKIQADAEFYGLPPRD